MAARKPKSEKLKGPPPAAKKRGRPKKHQADEAATENTVKIKEPVKAEDEDGAGDVPVDWGDQDLTWSLLNAIGSDPSIRQGLFPPPGANKSTSDGGGKRKTEFHWELAETVFADHPTYSDDFAKALSGRPALQRAWGLKIKNRLSAVVKIVRKHRDEMGQTGEGIMREEDIDMSQANVFTNKWAEIRVTCPWYWLVKSFIMERPNLVPAGIGNNTSNYDTSLLGTQQGKDNSTTGAATNTGGFTDSNQDDNSEFEPEDTADDSGNEIDQLMSDADDVDLPSSILDHKPTRLRSANAPDTTAAAEGDLEPEDAANRTSSKRKATDVPQDSANLRKKTGARPGTSTKAAKVQDTGKGKGVIEKFSDMAAREDETTRRALELKARRSEGANKLALAKLQAKLDMKKASHEAKIRLMEKKMDQEHELRLAQLRLSQRSGAAPWPSGPSPTTNLLPPDVPGLHFGDDAFDFGPGGMSVGSANSHSSSPGPYSNTSEGTFTDFNDI